MHFKIIRVICVICATKTTVCGLTNPQSKPRMLWKDNHGTEGGERLKALTILRSIIIFTL